ncbi:MAG: hypothetical protein K5870_00395 [Lachnospiraceae bacterium]|nr:hypothetical protein [Lachnospiraceae bacterium]
MHTLLQEMKKAGFRVTGSSVMFKNGEYVIAEKQKCIKAEQHHKMHG